MTGVLFCTVLITQISDPDTVFSTLDSVYRQYRVVYPDSGTSDSLFTRTTIDSIPQKSDQLYISGSKDFLFDIDQGFNQGLNVNIMGEVEGVAIEGYLSDKYAPSSSVRLSDVEKIRLLASSRNFTGGIGDLEIYLPFDIRDDIQGVYVSGHSVTKGHQISTAYAVDRGTTVQNRFQGEEGKQSPYMLNGPVVPGSERVHIAHGVALPEQVQRGEDYTIDYEQGILSFTSNQLITVHTRIEIEYKLAVQDYPKIYSAGSGVTSLPYIRLYGMARRRRDDKNDPLAFTLSQAEIESLTLSGDSSRVRHTYADTSSQGDYIVVSDHFVYVGQNNGTHVVTFFYVGESNGEYIYDPNIKAFSYQGPGFGNYTPTKYVPLPEQDILYGFGGTFLSTVTIDVFASQYDQNLFSPFEDTDNTGYGLDAEINRTYGIFTIGGTYIAYDEQFHKPLFQNEIDLPYQWNTNDKLEELAIGSVDITPWTFFSARTSYGMLNRDHYRRAISLHPLFFSLGYQSVDSIATYFAGVDHRISGLALVSRYEYRPQSHLFDYDVDYSFSKQTQVGLRGTYGQDSLGTGITTIADVQTIPFSLSLGHRQYNDTTFIFGNVRFSITLNNLVIQGTAEQSQRHLQKRDETFVKVDQGTGNYVYDPSTGTYVECENGDYVRKVFLLDEYERILSQAYDVEAQYRLSIAHLMGRFGFIDEQEYFRVTSDGSLFLGENPLSLEISARQDLAQDSRYSLYSLYERLQRVTLIPVIHRFTGMVDVQHQIDKLDTQVREQRHDYGGNVTYRIIDSPMVKPLLGYTYSMLSSEYFTDLDIRLHSLKGRLLIGIPLWGKGRLETAGEIINRIYNMEDIPMFFSLREPGGWTERAQVTANIRVGTQTVFSLTYSIEFPPDDALRQNLRLQTKILF